MYKRNVKQCINYFPMILVLVMMAQFLNYSSKNMVKCIYGLKFVSMYITKAKE